MAQTPLWERPVSYAAIGATQAEDFLAYPPEGYRPVELSARIGHGDARFEWAWRAARSWTIQRRSGFRVETVEQPATLTEATYVPVEFDEHGTPVAPAAIEAQPDGGVDLEGERMCVAGDTALLVTKVGPVEVKAPVRVVYLVDEPDVHGFAYGTLAGHPESGEQSFLVSRRPDGSVWLTTRVLTRPATAGWRLLGPALRLMQRRYHRRYLRALVGALPDAATDAPTD